MKDNIALIGKGYWGSKIKKYIPEFFNLKYVVGSNFDKNIIWNDKDISSIIIATPIETHYELAKEALLNNKNVFIEKPLTLKAIESIELIKIANDNSLKLAVEYTQTFAPSVLKAIEATALIGEIRYIEMSTKHLGRYMNFDVFWLLASHHLSMLDMIISLDKLGFKKEEYLYHNNLCTTGAIKFYNSNVTGSIEVSTDYPNKEMYFNIYGELGCIMWNSTKSKSVKIVLHNKTYAQLPKQLITDIWEFEYDELNNLRYSIKYFRDVLNNIVSSNTECALNVTTILEGL